ncbi:unnamed protein product [Mycena citricolor]|uniref:Transglycosylase SLT domain-containing protein n=1 Tax=Mycena citricolor TaxID=2018698 RepID=A0AAD2JWE1_9AGAR|nr:unnamed protein product [Mycena citricolor]
MILALPLVLLAACLAVKAHGAHGKHLALRGHAALALSRRSPALTALERRKSCKASPPAATQGPVALAPTDSRNHSSSTITAKKHKPTPKPVVFQANIGEIIQVDVSRCGSNGATAEITSNTGPNGKLDWLNCGLDTDSGWNPPMITVDDIIFVKDLQAALESPGSPFTACKPYIAHFNTYGAQFGIPPIMLASFAMQESTCNPSTVGGGGEQGLMQLSPEKCVNPPNGNCRDPEWNIMTGASFFAATLHGNNGNLLLSIGQYNGWYQSLTVAKATAAKNSACCLCQNNLDYLFQFANGWLQNVDPYTLNLGQYHNLNDCH